MINAPEYHLEIWPNEDDRAFLTKLDQLLLREFRAIRGGNNWGLGSAQEISQMIYKISGHQLIVQAETFMGISLHGPQKLVDQIATSLKAISGRE